MLVCAAINLPFFTSALSFVRCARDNVDYSLLKFGAISRMRFLMSDRMNVLHVTIVLQTC